MGLIIDSFAGGGGASTGIELALGRSPNFAINHDDEALAMHARNHPMTAHVAEDVWNVDMVTLVGGRPVDLLWASPDCTHHSKAKGGKPLDNERRGLADVIIEWVQKGIRPRVIILENVEEFRSWGPLLPHNNQPDPAGRGLEFERWLRELRAAGYAIEYRELRACDYGAPTSRKRLFVVARRDGLPIQWPQPTHGKGRPHPWRTAAECIDWSLPVPSIFERKKPLAEATLRRIARGVKRFVLDAAAPFVVPTPGGTLGARYMVQTSYGEREGQAPRVLDLGAPLGTVVAGGVKHALVTAFLAKHFGGGYEGPGLDLRLPMSTVTTVDHHALVACELGGPSRSAHVRAFISAYYGTSTGQGMQMPLGTVTAGALHHALVTVAGQQYEITDIGMRMLEPHELFRAQGFPDGYDISARTKGDQIRLCGNSVCPPIAAALVRANVGELARRAA